MNAQGQTCILAALLAAALAAGCSWMLEERRVKSDFLKEHPTYEVIGVGGPDGNDTDIVTFHIVYKKPGDGREYWSDWAYKQKDGKLELVGKGSEQVREDFSGSKQSQQ